MGSLSPSVGRRVVASYPLPYSTATAALLLGLLLAAPISLSEKTHHLLHGLCAQRPSHSFILDGSTLPLDARMTGIYGGFAVTFLIIACWHGLRAAAIPSKGVVGVLLLGLLAMAVDGLDGLATDTGAPNLYTPNSWLRLATGAGAGVALAVAMATLVGMTVWRRPHLHRAAIRRWWEPFICWFVAFSVLTGLLHVGGRFYAVIAIGLVGAALLVFALLTLVCGLLAAQRENSFVENASIDRAVAAALLGGALLILGLAAIRFGIERLTGVQPLP